MVVLLDSVFWAADENVVAVDLAKSAVYWSVISLLCEICAFFSYEGQLLLVVLIGDG